MIDRLFLAANITQIAAGLAGEHIAAAAVIARGWGCGMCQQEGVDLIAFKEKENYRIQVKSCQLSKSDRRLFFQTGIGRNKRLPTKSDYDILACVSAEQRTVWFQPVACIRDKKITKLPSFFADPLIEAESWQKTLEYLNGNTKQKAVRHNRSRNGAGRDSEFSPANW